jgi:hypothetical protein
MLTRVFISACVAAVAVLCYLWTSKQPLRVLDLAAIKHVVISADLSAGVTGPHGGCAHCNPQLLFPGSDRDSTTPATTQQGNFFINYRPQARALDTLALDVEMQPYQPLQTWT